MIWIRRNYHLIILNLILFVLIEVKAIVEPGYKDFKFTLNGSEEHSVNFTKSMYLGTSIILKIECVPEPEHKDEVSFKMNALLSFHRCRQPDWVDYPTDKHVIHLEGKCHQSVILPLKDVKKIVGVDIQKELKDAEKKSAAKKERRAAVKTVATTHATVKKIQVASTASSHASVSKNVGENHLPLTTTKALYRLKLAFTYPDKKGVLKFKVQIEAKYKGEYLSVLNWPLLPFYGVMSLVYLAYAIGWFTASCCNWRDLLRVQFWIGGVIAIGMFENALFYSEYQNIDHTGKENGLLYFAEIVSCIKRALARILVIIVSMGFGIVKPRLGQMLHKVIAAGTIYFILGSIEGCIRVRDDRLSKTQMYALIPLTVLDVALCWWVFSSLVQTTRTLRIRKNIVKLTLYRHFTNTLIFTVIASLAYMAWTIKETKFTNCIDIGTIWLNDALWPFLFGVILAVIMVLWRPSNNNQRYAFTPLDLGDSEDDDDDMTLSDAFEGMKMRNKTEQNGVTPKSKKKAEEDLKWVEENIPSVPSTMLPTIDSDEEILTTKFEISKMD